MRNSVLGLCLLAAAGSVLAERILPAGARHGTMEVGDYPQVRINGTRLTLSPGARIFDLSNRMILPQSLPPTAEVAYLLDLQGQLSKIWLVAPDEIERVKKAGN